jgi:hypothetical protein
VPVRQRVRNGEGLPVLGDEDAAFDSTEDGLPVHSFRTLLTDLATLTRNTW